MFLFCLPDLSEKFCVSTQIQRDLVVSWIIHIELKVQGGAKRTHVFEMGSSWECIFLWGYLKLKVYVRKARTVDDLKVSICEEIATVPQEILVNAMQNFEESFRMFTARRTPSFPYNFP